MGAVVSRIKPILSFVALIGSVFAIAVFFRASSELEVKRVLSSTTGLFRSYVPISECSLNSDRGDRFDQGVFDIGPNQSFDAYKMREDSLLIFSIPTNRNVYNSLERMAEGRPSDSARQGDQFYLFYVGSRDCAGGRGRNSYVEGVFHKR